MNFIKNIIIYIFYILFLFIIQISIINPFFSGYYYIYVITVLIYPKKWNRYLFLFFSFLIGWIMDYCLNSGGIHAFSTTLLSFFNLHFIQFFYRNRFMTNRSNVSIYHLPINKQLLYVFFLLSIHNISLLILKIIKNNDYFNQYILLKTIFNIIFTTVLCMIYFFFRGMKI